ncbi:MAG: ABC transporter permease [Salinibacter sp.]
MLRNYLKIAYRTLRSRPGVTTINVVGLAVGLAACLLIGLWIEHELSYDDFHPGAEHVYRVTAEIDLGGIDTDAPLSPAPMARAVVDAFPAVEAATRVGMEESATVEIRNQSFRETNLLTADSSFFDLFSGFSLRRGNPETALSSPNAAVLTASTARKYFGTTDVVGETIQTRDATRRVTGVLEPIPSASHLQFSMVLAQDLPPKIRTQWAANNYYTYLRLTEGTKPSAFERRFDKYVEAEVLPKIEEAFGMSIQEMVAQQGGEYRYNLQRLTDIYLQADSSYEIGPTGSRAAVYVFAVVAFLTLLIACINFMNLVTARASERATEVGIRKAMGAGRSQLTGQFLGEAVLTTAGAFGLAVGLAVLARPLFVQLSGVPLSVDALLSGPVLLTGGVGIVLVGLLAGSYPAFILSRFDPAEALKVNNTHGSGGGPAWVRRGLVGGQFVVSIALIAGTLVVGQQYEYIQDKQLGIDRERVVVLDRAQSLGDRQDAFLERVRRTPDVVTASTGDRLFGFLSQDSFLPAGKPPDASKGMSALDVSPRFVETTGAAVVAGRSFEPGRPADSTAVVLNRTAAETFGWSPQEAVGNRVQEVGDSISTEVIGVVENFHYQSLRNRVRPLVLRHTDSANRVFVRLESGRAEEAVDQIRTAWTEMGGARPFEYTFLDQSFDRLHRSTQRTGRLLGAFSGIAIVIACLGLFGLATYIVQRRTKEIGIRKALGATSTQIVGLVSKEFAALVGVAFVVAAPLAYVSMQQWLQTFAYRTSVGVGTLVVAGAAALLLTLLTVSVHALRAARTDPARTLRDE